MKKTSNKKCPIENSVRVWWLKLRNAIAIKVLTSSGALFPP